MTTITHQCKKCGRTYAVSCNDVFYTTVNTWMDTLSMFHALTHHWSTLQKKAHRWAPFYIIVKPLHCIAALVWDLLRLALLIVTWPFWWLHEEVL